MSQWETMAKDPAYKLVKDAIEAGLDRMVKWYRHTGNTPIYFVAHGKCCHLQYSSQHILTWLVLDPVRCDQYLCVAWEEEFFDVGMSNLCRMVT